MFHDEPLPHKLNLPNLRKDASNLQNKLRKRLKQELDLSLKLEQERKLEHLLNLDVEQDLKNIRSFKK